MRDQNKAIEQCEKARAQWTRLGNTAAQVRCLATLGDLHRRNNDAGAAAAAVREIISVSKQLSHDELNKDKETQDHIASAHNRLGSAAYESKNWAEALQHFEHNVKLREALVASANKPCKLLSDAYYWLALVLKEVGDPHASVYIAKSEACLPPEGEEEDEEWETDEDEDQQ